MPYEWEAEETEKRGLRPDVLEAILRHGERLREIERRVEKAKRMMEKARKIQAFRGVCRSLQKTAKKDFEKSYGKHVSLVLRNGKTLRKPQ